MFVVGVLYGCRGLLIVSLCAGDIMLFIYYENMLKGEKNENYFFASVRYFALFRSPDVVDGAGAYNISSLNRSVNFLV